MKKLKCIIKLVVLAFMLNIMLIPNAKAQLPSSDPAFQLVWQDTFPTWNGYKIDTSKWSQKYRWNQSDSILPTWFESCGCYKNLDRAYSKWYLPIPSPPVVPSAWPPDTTNCQVTGYFFYKS